jgi:Predicted membrane-associated Zn-dependent proteases 1
MLGTLAVLLVFGGLIFFHELGHFLVARCFNMGVRTFSLGFGPRLLSMQRGKTRYQIAAFPLGGYVSLVGEVPFSAIPALVEYCLDDYLAGNFTRHGAPSEPQNLDAVLALDAEARERVGQWLKSGPAPWKH